MGYYPNELSAKSKELCTIVSHWGKYEYQQLPMGMCNSPNNFQEKMSELYECLFDSKLGTSHGKPYGIKLQLDAEPYHGKPFPVPRIHELTFKQELDQLEYLKVNKER